MRKFYLLTLWLCMAVAFGAHAQQTYTICQGDTVRLHASGADLYEWLPHTGLDDPYSPNPIARPSTTTTYQVRRLRTSGDLIRNGSFSQGNTQFTSQYRDSTRIDIEGYYAITQDPSQNHISMNRCQDHTTGTGNMMVVNGVPVANQIVWSQVINVVPNTNYAFSTFVNAGISDGGFATLQFSINNTLLGEQFSTRYEPCAWQQFYTVWNSGTATTATISIVNQNLQRSGNDFALDDIFFQSFTVLTDSAIVNVKPALAAPAVTVNGDLTPCEGSSVSFSGPSAVGYRWNDGATTQTRNVNTSGNYVLRVLGANGCYSFPSDTVKVDVQPLPNAPVISLVGSATTICPGDSVQLTSTAASTYLWSNGKTTQSIYALGVNPSTSTTFTAQAVSAQGCRSVSSNGITVTTRTRPGQPRVALSGDSVFCAGGNVTLTSSYNINNRWSTGETTPSITVSTAGQYWVYAQSAASCPSLKRYVNIAVGGQGQRPTVAASGSTTICPGGSVTLTSNFPTGNTWSNGAVTQSITVSAGGNYTVTNAGACGTATSLPVTVTVATLLSVPTISAPADRALCQGESIVLTSSSATGNVWSNGATTQTITVTDAGTYTVHVVSGTCRTAESAGITVTVQPKPGRPSVTSNGPVTFCSGSDVVLTSSAASGNLWSNGATTQSITVNAAGTYYVRVQNSACASDTSNKTVVVIHQPPVVPNINSPAGLTACEGGSVNLTSSFNGSNIWSNGATAQGIAVSTVGTTTVTVRSISTRGCISAPSQPVSVVISPMPANPTISPAAAQSICPGGTVQLTSSAATGNIWSNGAITQSITVNAAGNFSVRVVAQGCSSQVSAPVTVSVVNLSTPSITTGGTPTTFCDGGSVTLTSSALTGNRWSNGDTTRAITVSTGGNYTVQVQARGCSSSVSPAMTVTVNALPATPTITASGPLTFCQGGSVTLTSSATSNNRWSNGSQGNQTTISQSGSYGVYSISAQGCSSLVSQPVLIDVQAAPGTPTITASGPLNICEGNSVTLTSSAGANSAWSRGDTGTSIVVTQAGSYAVTAFTTAGCGSAGSLATVVTVEALPQQASITLIAPDTLMSSIDAASFEWRLNGDILPGQNSRKLYTTLSGRYTVAALSTTNCMGPASTEFIFTPVAITGRIATQSLYLAPNPASNLLTITGTDGLQAIQVRDALGRTVLKVDGGRTTRYTLSLADLPAGAYSIQATTVTGTAMGRFVKE